VHLVLAPTTVTDARGNSIDGLAQEDFRLWDNGELRKIEVEGGGTLISLAIAIQRSSSSAAVLNKVRKIGSMIEPLVTGERGEVAVVAFDSEVQVRQEFTSDSGKLRETLAGIRPGDGAGRLIDAVAESVRLLEGRPAGRRRVLLLVSETRDRGSEGKCEDVLTAASRANVTVYPLTYSAYTTAFTAKRGTTPAPDWEGNPLLLLFELGRLAKVNAAQALAESTGGERLSFTTLKALERAVERMGADLHTQYLLSFTVPEEEKAVFHRIKVTVPSRPDAQIRTRPGYWMATAQP
jgi:VWFA-related protein